MNLTDKGKEYIRGEIPGKIYFTDKYKITKNIKEKVYTISRGKIENIMYTGNIKQYRKNDRKLIKVILKENPDIKKFLDEIKKFKKCFKTFNRRKLERLIKKWKNSKIPILRTYTKGIYNDYDAVKNAVESSLTNGIAEGKINKIKTVKRMCYGRAGFELLQARLFLNDYFHSIE